MLYLKSGTFTGCRSNDDVDHAVLLIGWKIKNSWGTRWEKEDMLESHNKIHVEYVKMHFVQHLHKNMELQIIRLIKF